MATQLECEQGADLVADLTLVDSTGAAVTTFTGAATLAASVWGGDDQASLFTPTATWIDATAGTVRLVFGRTGTAALAPGDYPVLLTITAGSYVRKRQVATLRILPAPGSATALKTITTYDQLLRYTGDIAAELTENADQAGYAEQRNLAYQWAGRTCLARAQMLFDLHFERHVPVVTQDEITITTGIDAGPWWGPSIYPNTTKRAALVEVAGWFDSDYLMTDAEEDSNLIEAVSRYAAYLIYSRQLQANADNRTNYQGVAAAHRREAITKLAAHTFRFDTDSDGVADRWIYPI